MIYDTALRGIHHHGLLRELPLLPVNRVTAAVRGADKPRGKDGRRVEKSVHTEDKQVILGDGTVKTCRLYARGGERSVSVSSPMVETSIALARIRTHRIKDKGGLFRWVQRLPPA